MANKIKSSFSQCTLCRVWPTMHMQEIVNIVLQILQAMRKTTKWIEKNRENNRSPLLARPYRNRNLWTALCKDKTRLCRATWPMPTIIWIMKVAAWQLTSHLVNMYVVCTESIYRKKESCQKSGRYRIWDARWGRDCFVLSERDILL